MATTVLRYLIVGVRQLSAVWKGLSPSLPLLFLLVLLLLATIRRPGVSQVVVRDSAGVRIIENGYGGLPVLENWRLSEQPLLEIGGLEARPGHDLFRVVGAVRLADGTIVVANAGSHELRFYDGTGRYERVSGRRGGGPGEFRDLMDIWAIGDTLIAYDGEGSRLSLFTSRGIFIGDFTLRHALAGIAPFPTHVDLFSDGSSLVVAQRLLPTGTVRTGIVRDSALYLHCDTHGTVADTVGRFPGTEVFIQTHGGGTLLARPAFGRTPVLATREAGFYFGSSDSYEIGYYSVDGRLQFIIRKAQPNATVTAGDMRLIEEQRLERARSDMDRAVIQRTFADMPIPESMPACSALVVDAEQNLWVEDYARPGDRRGRWTVFNPDGAILAEVDVPSRFTVHQIGGDFVLGVWRDDLDIEHVQLYGIRKGG